jgi:hypothetical protein
VSVRTVARHVRISARASRVARAVGFDDDVIRRASVLRQCSEGRRGIVALHGSTAVGPLDIRAATARAGRVARDERRYVTHHGQDAAVALPLEEMPDQRRLSRSG